MKPDSKRFMRKRVVIWMGALALTIGVLGMSSTDAPNARGPERTGSAAPLPQDIALRDTAGESGTASAACQEPPPTFLWENREYALTTIGREDLEPGMKLGYLDCRDGVYMQRSEGENATFNVYSFGSPLKSGDLLYFGPWGRALYTAVRVSESVRAVEEPKMELKPEVREIQLDPRLEQELQEKKRPLQGVFETVMEQVQAGGKIDLYFSLANISGKDLQVVHGSGQRYDIWVYNDRDEEVYRWSYDKAFTAALIERKLKKSAKLEFHEEWNLQDNQGKPVPAGIYTIVVKVMLGLGSGTVSQDELTAQSTVELGW